MIAEFGQHEQIRVFRARGADHAQAGFEVEADVVADVELRGGRANRRGHGGSESVSRCFESRRRFVKTRRHMY